MATIRLIIQGKVQGVFYRATAKKEAERLKIKGWIKNTRQGDVEIVCQGDNKALEAFVDWCWKGPTHAEVEKILQEEVKEEPYDDFKIVRE